MKRLILVLCGLLPLLANAQSKFHLFQKIPASNGIGVTMNIYQTDGDGNTVEFRVANTDSIAYGVAVAMDLDNMQANVRLPYQGNIPANTPGERKLFSITRVDNGKPFYFRNFTWRLSATPYSTVAANRPTAERPATVHDKDARPPIREVYYRYPWPAGKSFTVDNAFNGYGAHQGKWAYAVDFKMPIGTPVTAAREGEVVAVQDGFSVGRNDPSLADRANYVFIRHDDGSLGRYLHLKQNGAKVRAGQRVSRGDVIALSGNVGWTTAPHLHFDVVVNSGSEPHSIPFKFIDPNGTTFTPAVGMVLPR